MEVTISYRNIAYANINQKVAKKIDLVELETAIEDIANINDSVRIMIHISHLKWITWKAGLESIRVFLKNKEVIDRVAIVAHNKIYRLGAEFDNLFTPWEERYFDVKDIDKAWTWLKEE